MVVKICELLKADTPLTFGPKNRSPDVTRPCTRTASLSTKCPSRKARKSSMFHLKFKHFPRCTFLTSSRVHVFCKTGFIAVLTFLIAVLSKLISTSKRHRACDVSQSQHALRVAMLIRSIIRKYAICLL